MFLEKEKKLACNANSRFVCDLLLLLLSYDVSLLFTSNETFVYKKNQYFCLVVKQSNSNKQNYFLVNNEQKALIDQKKKTLNGHKQLACIAKKTTNLWSDSLLADVRLQNMPHHV